MYPIRMRYYGERDEERRFPACLTCCLVFLLVVAAVTSVFLIFDAAELGEILSPVSEEEVSLAFEQFVKDYDKQYGGSEMLQRRQAFAFNYRRIEEYNRREDRTLSLGINQFADLSDEEFEQMYLSTPSDNPQCTVAHLSPLVGLTESGDVPSKLLDKDWVKEGKVAPVKDQGMCGSCWTFAATTATETIYAIKHKLNSPLLLSEQQLVDCCRTEVSRGCSGGMVSQAFEHSMTKGTRRQKDYPYHARDEHCYEDSKEVAFKLDNYKNLTEGSLEEMEDAIMNQTIAVGVVVNFLFRFYKSGVITEGCPETPIGHGVAVVGAGAEKGIDFWLVRNSWGPNWGLHGYLKIARKGGPKMGVCGIKACPQVPLYEAK